MPNSKFDVCILNQDNHVEKTLKFGYGSSIEGQDV